MNMNTHCYEYNGARNLTADQFWTLIDRDHRNALLEFEDICKKRDEESLIITLRHWQGKEGKIAETYANIVMAEIKERMGLLVL